MIPFCVGLGGAVGAILRFFISGWVQKLSGSLFPYGTLFVNIAGSFLMGFLVMVFEDLISPEWKALLITGMLGALTTFSTFSYETVVMLQEGMFAKAVFNILLNMFLCISAVVFGNFVYIKAFKI